MSGQDQTAPAPAAVERTAGPRRPRAVVCDGQGGVRIEAVPPPSPGAGEVLLRLRRGGICGTDLWKLRQRTAAAGSVLGHEVVGIVEAVGSGAEGDYGGPGGAATPGGDGTAGAEERWGLGAAGTAGAGGRRGPGAAGAANAGAAPTATRTLPAVGAHAVDTGGADPGRPEGGEWICRPGDRVVAVHHVACGVCAYCLQGSETMCPAFQQNLLAPGGWSDLVLVRRRAVAGGLFLLPDQLSDDAAVFLEPAACVLRGLARAGLAAPGERGGQAEGAPAPVVAILGAGSMGLLHLLVLRALHGAAVRVVLSEPLAARRALARRLGADGAAAPGQPLHRRVMELSEGRGADVVIDTVGGGAPLAEALAVGRTGGTVLLFAHAGEATDQGGGGSAEGQDQSRHIDPKGSSQRADDAAPDGRDRPRTDAWAAFPFNAFFKSERRLIATYSSGRAEQMAACQLLASGRLDPRPLVSHRLPLEAAAEAVELAATRRALKVLLVPDADQVGPAARRATHAGRAARGPADTPRQVAAPAGRRF
jgi:L-iditol 2-dehydrogenase